MNRKIYNEFVWTLYKFKIASDSIRDWGYCYDFEYQDAVYAFIDRYGMVYGYE